MNLHPVFPSFIAIEPNMVFDNTLLETYCKEQISKSNKQNQSDHLNLSAEPLQGLIISITELSNRIAKTIGLKPTQSVVRAWANIDNNTAIGQPHSHTKSVFSCVYYVKGSKESGELTFMTPINCLDYVIDRDYINDRTDFNTTEISIPPIPGSLVIFPSWLTHYVKPNQSNHERISIAFETNFI
jgi:uncharacterized protein (TIGR02466 family)